MPHIELAPRLRHCLAVVVSPAGRAGAQALQTGAADPSAGPGQNTRPRIADQAAVQGQAAAAGADRRQEEEEGRGDGGQESPDRARVRSVGASCGDRSAPL